MTYLIADSGSTKTSWMLVAGNGHRTELETPGINPIRDSEEQMEQVLDKLTDNLRMRQAAGASEPLSIIRYYGAGCIPPYSDTLRHILQRHFPDTIISVESDLLGAAHALCGTEEGVACILGTGSNSCLYDGQRIVENVSPLGYILGDEGSGAVLGRNLVGDLLKGQMPPTLLQAFHDETGLTRAHIIDKVYRQPQANRFLASLVPFLAHHREEEAIHQFLVNNFRRFFRRNVALYHRPDLPVHFVGGVAHTFCDELQEAAQAEGFTTGRTLLRPIDAIADYLLRIQS